MAETSEVLKKNWPIILGVVIIIVGFLLYRKTPATQGVSYETLPAQDNSAEVNAVATMGAARLQAGLQAFSGLLTFRDNQENRNFELAKQSGTYTYNLKMQQEQDATAISLRNIDSSTEKYVTKSNNKAGVKHEAIKAIAGLGTIAAFALFCNKKTARVVREYERKHSLKPVRRSNGLTVISSHQGGRQVLKNGFDRAA